MGVIHRHSGGSSNEDAPPAYDVEKHGEPKGDYLATSGEVATDGNGVAVHSDHAHLHRGLKSRHITMIAIGGAIGTGLIIGTGKALAQAG